MSNLGGGFEQEAERTPLVAKQYTNIILQRKIEYFIAFININSSSYITTHIHISVYKNTYIS